MDQHHPNQEYNIRATMPSKFISHHIEQLRSELNNIQKTNSHKIVEEKESKTKASFFVRVSKEDLEEQKAVYKWRMNCCESVISICSIKLQSEGNCYNPNYLFKVELETSKSNFWQIKDLALTKCIKFIKSTLDGVNSLFQYFEPVSFNEKMIHITSEGEAKIWTEERYYINPNNSLYSSHGEEVSLKDSIQSLITLFEKKCLRTKLSMKLFTLLKFKSTVKEMMESIENFEKEEHLFPYKSCLKNSLSTAQPKTINSSESLEFSINNSNKKRKDKVKVEEKFNLASSCKFLQAKSMELKSFCISPLRKEKGKDEKIIYKSQNETNKIFSPHKFQPQENERNNTNPEKTFCSRKDESLVISEILQEEESPIKEIKVEKEKKITNKNSSSAIQNQPIKNHFEENKIMKQKSLSKASSDSEEEDHNRQRIIAQNGWNKGIGSLFDKKNMKESINEGFDHNINEAIILNKLHTMGKEVQEFEFEDEDEESFNNMQI